MKRTQSAQPLPAPVRTLVIVHGNADTRALYRAMLEGSSYAIEECEDGAEALVKALTAHPDVIVADARLARIDGMSLCRLLRADAATRAIAVVLLMSTDNSVEAVRARTAGADRIVVAPCSEESLHLAVHDACEVRSEAPTTTPAVREEGANADSPVSSHRARSRTFRREHTTTPPNPPPALHCPSCEAILAYEHSQTGGVNAGSPEQWDYFRCATCGPFQYRQRTRKLRAT